MYAKDAKVAPSFVDMKRTPDTPPLHSPMSTPEKTRLFTRTGTPILKYKDSREYLTPPDDEEDKQAEEEKKQQVQKLDLEFRDLHGTEVPAQTSPTFTQERKVLFVCTGSNPVRAPFQEPTTIFSEDIDLEEALRCVIDMPLQSLPKEASWSTRELLSLERNIVKVRETGVFHQPSSCIGKYVRGLSLSYNVGAHRKGECSKILPWLYLGGSAAAMSKDALLAMQVTHILNVSRDIPFHFDDGRSFVYSRIPINDSTREDAIPMFPKALAFLQRVENVGGRVLVHCNAGVSRAATMVVLYLMLFRNLPLRDAHDYVRLRRTQVNINHGFLYQLALVELKHYGMTSIMGSSDWNFYRLNRLKAYTPQTRETKGMMVTSFMLG